MNRSAQQKAAHVTTRRLLDMKQDGLFVIKKVVRQRAGQLGFPNAGRAKKNKRSYRPF